MASLKCNNCGYGIHHTQDLDGIERTAFLIEEWQKLSVSDIPLPRYDLDGPENFLIFWVCPKCGTMHMMIGSIPLIYRAYRPIALTNRKERKGRRCIFFEDKAWYDIVELDLRIDNYKSVLPANTVKYAIIGKNFMDIYQDEACTEMLDSYELIPFDYSKPYKPYPAPWNEEM